MVMSHYFAPQCYRLYRHFMQYLETVLSRTLLSSGLLRAADYGHVIPGPSNQRLATGAFDACFAHQVSAGAYEGDADVAVVEKGFCGDAAGGYKRYVRQGLVHHADVTRAAHSTGREDFDGIGAGFPGGQNFRRGQGSCNDQTFFAVAVPDDFRFERRGYDEAAPGVDGRNALVDVGDAACADDELVAEKCSTALDDLGGVWNGHGNFSNRDSTLHERLHNAQRKVL